MDNIKLPISLIWVKYATFIKTKYVPDFFTSHSEITCKLLPGVLSRLRSSVRANVILRYYNQNYADAVKRATLYS